MKLIDDTYKSIKNVILLGGTSSSGKTQMLIEYANAYPDTTLFVSGDLPRGTLQERGLKQSVYCFEVKNDESLLDIDFFSYKSVLIDYLEIFDKETIHDFVKRATELNLKVVVATHMKPNGSINNVFQL